MPPRPAPGPVTRPSTRPGRDRAGGRPDPARSPSVATRSRASARAGARWPSLLESTATHDLGRRRRRGRSSRPPPPAWPRTSRARGRPRRPTRTAGGAAARVPPGVASGPTRLPVRGSSCPPVSSAVTPGRSCSAGNVSGPLVTTVSSRTPAMATGEALQGRSRRRPRSRRRRRPGRRSFAAMRSFARTGAGRTGRRTAAVRRPARRPGCAGPARPRRAVEVAPDGHLADVELDREVGHLDPAGPVDRASRMCCRRSTASTLMVVRLPGGGACVGQVGVHAEGHALDRARCRRRSPRPARYPTGSAAQLGQSVAERDAIGPARRTARSARPRRAARRPARPCRGPSSRSTQRTTTAGIDVRAPGPRRRRSRRACPRGRGTGDRRRRRSAPGRELGGLLDQRARCRGRPHAAPAPLEQPGAGEVLQETR